MLEMSEQINELSKALCLCQAEFPVAKKKKENTFFSKGQNKSTYADLCEIVEVSRQILTKNGITVFQFPSTTPERFVRMTTMLVHTSGQWMRSSMDFKPKDDSPQTLGGCVTYARRYTLAPIIGVVSEDEDDDGNVAQGLSPSYQRRQEYKREMEEYREAKEEAKANANAKPREVIFDKGADAHIKWLENALISNNITTDNIAKYATFLHGKVLDKESFSSAKLEFLGENRDVF